jgi:hypothetical protein
MTLFVETTNTVGNLLPIQFTVHHLECAQRHLLVSGAQRSDVRDDARSSTRCGKNFEASACVSRSPNTIYSLHNDAAQMNHG